MHILDRCDLCGRSGPFIRLAAQVAATDRTLNWLGVSGSYTTVACLCGWIFKPGVLSSAQLAQLYGQDGGEATVEAQAARLVRKRAEETYRLLNPQMERSSGSLRVLDVGGGIGQVSQAFADHGYQVDILDFGHGAPLRPGMRMIRGSLSDLPADARYDVVLMSHVLEHVWSPRTDLSRVRALLQPHGRLFVEVPFELYTPVVKRKLGDPHHVGYFTLRTLREFLRVSGFMPLRVYRYVGLYNERRVMTLRAIAAPGTAVKVAKRRPLGLPAALSSMVAPQQLWHILRSR